MLRFFRKIRHSFLKKGNIQQYIFYAIGEIFLVVIGILIALQINNWNQLQSLKKLEQEYLINLKRECQLNLEELNLVYQNRENTINDIIKLMELSGTNPKGCTDAELAKMLNSVYDYARIVFGARTPILEELKSSGNIVNISNSVLRGYLTTWEQAMGGVHGTQEEYKQFRADFLSLIAIDGSMKDIGKAEKAYRSIQGLHFKNTNKELLKNKRAGNLLYLLYGELEWFNKDVYPNSKNHIEEIISLINQELK